MGSSSYNLSSRMARATTMNYASADLNTTFTQQKSGKIHESMDPKGVAIRESADSELHPTVVPFILGMDETGSMMDLPKFLVSEGFPHLISKLLERGIDPALLFTALGDHESDRHPFQIGQFESGDAELDMWLTRTFLEKNGGGNGGESYMLPWYFASFHTRTDAWDKRGKKGFLFTVGDEPCLPNLPARAITEIFGDTDVKSYSSAELIKLASEKWNVFHIHIAHRGGDEIHLINGWRDLLGENFYVVNRAEEVADKMIDVISKFHNPSKSVVANKNSNPKLSNPTKVNEEEML